MTIFAVIQQPHPSHSALSVAIFQAYPDDTYDLGNGAWLISDSVTAKEVSDKIGISDGTNGSAVVITNHASRPSSDFRYTFRDAFNW